MDFLIPPLSLDAFHHFTKLQAFMSAQSYNTKLDLAEMEIELSNGSL